MTLLYRSMKTAVDQLPQCGSSRRELGLLSPGDILTDDNGLVFPDTGGLSVSPLGVSSLPSHRRPLEYGGTGKDPVFVLESSLLEGVLTYRANTRSRTHGLIEPNQPMMLEKLQELFCRGRSQWVPIKQQKPSIES